MRSEAWVRSRGGALVLPAARVLVLMLALALSGVTWRGVDTASAAETEGFGGHHLHLGTQAGWWNFNDSFRFEDDIFYGLRAGAWITPSVSLEIDLEQLRTRDLQQQDWVNAVFLSLHGRYQWRPQRLFSPGVLAGVSFMPADNEAIQNSITEGLDLGAGLQLRLTPRASLLGEMLFRYTSLRVNRTASSGNGVQDSAVEYVWSHGFRLGVDLAF
jgi:hypothetical protein